jgi:TolA-binding protein
MHFNKHNKFVSNTLKLKAAISIIAIMFLFQGCGLWDNFTTYFNRYYNAELSFEEAELAIATDSKRELFEFKEPTVPSGARKNLDDVIEKCSKILQFNTESDYFAAAVFMIGKSYYYQGNFTKALRKFRELESIPESELALENQLWIAKSELQMRRFEVGIEVLNRVKEEAEKDENEEILFNAYLAEIRYLTYREEYSDAIKVVKKLIEVSSSDEISAELAFEMGKLYLKLNDLENAAASFAEVDEYSPTFDIQFESMLEYAKVEKELGETEVSLDILDDLRNEDKFNDQIDRVELETANIYFQTEEIEKALDLYTEIDTTYATTESSGIAAFMRADIMEKHFADLDSAEVLFNRVEKSRAPKEYKDKAREKSNLYKSIKLNLSNIDKFTRQHNYSLDSTLFKRDSTLYDEYFIMKDSLALLMTEMKELEGSDFDASKYTMREDPPFDQKPLKSRLSADSLWSGVANAKFNLGNLYFSELDMPDSAYRYYNQVIEDHRESKLFPRALYALGTYYLTKDDKQKADSLFNIVYDNYKEDKIVNAAAEKLGKSKIAIEVDPAEVMFIYAEEVYDSNNYHQAISKFQDLIDKYPQSSYAAKSMYTIGFILENDLALRDSAAIVYDSLTTKFSLSNYAQAVKNKLVFYQVEKKKIADSLSRAAEAVKDSLTAEKMGISVDSLHAIPQKPADFENINTAEETKGIENDRAKEPGIKPAEEKIDSSNAAEKKPKRPGRPRGKK